jgi:hypothetical protein
MTTKMLFCFSSQSKVNSQPRDLKHRNVAQDTDLPNSLQTTNRTLDDNSKLAYQSSGSCDISSTVDCYPDVRANEIFTILPDFVHTKSFSRTKSLSPRMHTHTITSYTYRFTQNLSGSDNTLSHPSHLEHILFIHWSYKNLCICFHSEASYHMAA